MTSQSFLGVPRARSVATVRGCGSSPPTPLAELVADVVDEVRAISQARGGTAVGVTWYMAELIDDAEGAERMAHELAAAEGVELPARVSA